MTLRTTRPYAAMGRYSDLDRFRLLVPQHLHFVIYEAHKSLHPVQNGLNLKLNSWFPPFDSFCLDKKRLSRLARSVFLFFSPAPPISKNWTDRVFQYCTTYHMSNSFGRRSDMFASWRRPTIRHD